MSQFESIDLTADIDGGSYALNEDFVHVVAINRDQARPVHVRFSATEAWHVVEGGAAVPMIARGQQYIYYRSAVGRLAMTLLAGDETMKPFAWPPKQRHSVERYEFGSVEAVRGNAIAYVSNDDNTVLHYSQDMGANVYQSYTFAEVVTCVFITVAGSILVVTEADGKLYRSTDDGYSFTEATDTVPAPLTGVEGWHNQHAIVDTGSMILFATYGADGVANKYIYRSLTDGATWDTPLTKTHSSSASPVGDVVRHFHTLVWDRKFSGKFLATTGDSGVAVRWFVGSADGGTWTTEVADPAGSTNRQRHRCLNTIFPTPDKVLFAADSSAQDQGLWMADLTMSAATPVLSNETYILPLDGQVYAFLQHGPDVYISSNMSNANPTSLPTIWHGIIADGVLQVDSLRRVISWEYDETELPIGGFVKGYGPDAEGRFYFTVANNTLGRTDINGVRIGLPPG